MKLYPEITIYPPPITDNNGKLIIPPPMVLNNIDVTYHDNPNRKMIYVTISNIPGYLILFSDQEYDILGNYTKQDLENRLELELKYDADKKIRAMFPKTLEENPNGPGSILSKMISRIGIKSTPNCSCRKHAIEMNEKGNDWCEQNISVILGWLQEESLKRNLPFVESVAKFLVQRAINTSRKLLTKL